MTEYYIPTGPSETEFVEKRSRFIGHVWRVEGEEEARARIEEMKKRYYDARHNCWCYLIQDGPVRYSDDGEPQGTAGQPMLNVFQREGGTNVCCVVTRYFGGVLLGAGGLVRAYSEAAAKALDAAGLCQYVPVVRWGFAVDYAHWARLDRFLQSSDIQLEQTDYGAEVLCQGLSRKEAWEPFRQALYNHCDGRVEVQFAEHAIAPWPID